MSVAIHRSIDPFLRRQPWKHRGIDPATGRKFCFCGCGQPVGPRRKSSAGPECVKWWRSHSDANHIRVCVEERDKGVCALCGRDTEKLKREWATALGAYEAEKSKGYSDEYLKAWRRPHWTQVIRIYWDKPDLPLPPAGFPKEDRRWWEADHIVPVIEGGGGCDYTGYRTLCIPCHKSETAKLAARRAQRRAASKIPTTVQ